MNKPSLNFTSSGYRPDSLSDSLSELNLLRPAGTQLILEDDETTFFDYLRLTFSDLLLKRVIDVEIVVKKAHHRDKRAQSYYMIKPGSNFKFYQPAFFEKTFINALNPKGTVLLKVYIENVFNESPRDRPYKKSLVNQLFLKPYFHKGLAYYLFNDLNLNNHGKAFKQEIHNYIFNVNSLLNTWIENEPQKVMGMLSVLGGNVFLIPCLDALMWNRICRVAKTFEKTDTISFSTAPDLQELTPSYFRPEIFPIITYFYSRVEKFISYNGVLSGTNSDSMNWM